jgi:hypothetical protein
VYDDFLPRLDTLPTAEIDAIYDAYELIRHAIDTGKVMVAAKADDREDAALAVFFSSENALNGMERALRSLPHGDRNVTELMSKRGSQRERYEGIREAFESARPSRQAPPSKLGGEPVGSTPRGERARAEPAVQPPSLEA